MWLQASLRLPVVLSHQFVAPLDRASGGRERVAVVTGAAQGLGEAIAPRFVSDGYRAVYGDVNIEANEQAAAAAHRAVAFARQASTESNCLTSNATANTHSPLGVDVWINNVARIAVRPLLEIAAAEQNDVLETNLRGTYFGQRVAGLHMKERSTEQVGRGVLVSPGTRALPRGTRGRVSEVL